MNDDKKLEETMKTGLANMSPAKVRLFALECVKRCEEICEDPSEKATFKRGLEILEKYIGKPNEENLRSLNLIQGELNDTMITFDSEAIAGKALWKAFTAMSYAISAAWSGKESPIEAAIDAAKSAKMAEGYYEAFKAMKNSWTQTLFAQGMILGEIMKNNK